MLGRAPAPHISTCGRTNCLYLFIFMFFALRIPAKCKCKWSSSRLQRCFYAHGRLFIEQPSLLLLRKRVKKMRTNQDFKDFGMTSK